MVDDKTACFKAEQALCAPRIEYVSKSMWTLNVCHCWMSHFKSVHVNGMLHQPPLFWFQFLPDLGLWKQEFAPIQQRGHPIDVL